MRSLGLGRDRRTRQSLTGHDRALVDRSVHARDRNGGQLAIMRTTIVAWDGARTALFGRKFVRTADRHVHRWGLALLRTTHENLYVSRVRALWSPGGEPRVSDERRAREETLASARSGSHIAGARSRSSGCTQGRGDDAGGSRRENVDHQERRLASRKRCAYAPDFEHHREICARGGRAGRDVRPFNMR